MPRQRTVVEACAVMPEDPEIGLLSEVQAYLSLRLQGVDPGEHRAAVWHRFYRLYAPLIQRLVRRFHLLGPDTEDCVQEIWLALVTRVARMRPATGQSHIRSWLAVVARNVVVDLVRERTRHPHVPLNAEVCAGLIDHEPGPADTCERVDIQMQLLEILSGLAHRVSFTTFRVLHLRLIEDRPVGEVAAELDLTPAQVRLWYHRGLLKLRALIERRGSGSRSERRVGSPLSLPPPHL